jgi:hypothetical protein
MLEVYGGRQVRLWKKELSVRSQSKGMSQFETLIRAGTYTFGECLAFTNEDHVSLDEICVQGL